MKLNKSKLNKMECQEIQTFMKKNQRIYKINKKESEINYMKLDGKKKFMKI